MSILARTLAGADIPGLNPPQQKRSAIAQRRIIESLEELLAERDYFEIKVSDIAARAGCALGGVYNRFESKDHILLALAEATFVERIDPRYQRQENPDWHIGLSVEAFLEIYFAVIAKALVDYRHIFRPLFVISRYRTNDAFTEFLDERERKAQAHLASVMLSLARAGDPGVTESAARLAAYWARSLLSDYLLFGEKSAAMTGVSDDRYFTELARLVSQYLAPSGCKSQARE